MKQSKRIISFLTTSVLLFVSLFSFAGVYAEAPEHSTLNENITEQLSTGGEAAVASQTQGVVSGAVYRIKQRMGTKYLTVNPNSGGNYDANMNNVSVAEATGGLEQLFRIVYNSTDDIYYIKPMVSNNGNNRVVDVNSTNLSQITDGANIHIFNPGDENSSQWQIVYSAVVDSYHFKINCKPEYSMEMQNNNNVELGLHHGGLNQSWALERVTVNLNATNIELEKGNTFQLTATLDMPGTHTFTYGVIFGNGVSVSNTGLITATDYGSATIFVSTTYNGQLYSASCSVKVPKRAIIVIPGIMGSNLYMNENITIPYFDFFTFNNSFAHFYANDKIWDPLPVENISIAKIIALMCDAEGFSYFDLRLYNQSDSDEYYGTDDIYHDLIIRLNNQFGPSGSSVKKYAIEFFDYDWRMSNLSSATRLENFINTKGYDKVVLVAHSMGGIVASNYIAKGPTQRYKVEKLITLGTPFYGSLDMTAVALNHEMPRIEPWMSDFIEGFEDPLSDALPNMASIYQLLPTEQFFSVAEKSYLSYHGTHFADYETTKEHLQNYIRECNDSLFELAEAINSSLYINGEHVTSLVDSYYICGYNVETIDSLNRGLFDANYKKTYSLAGDGSVPLCSASMNGIYTGNTFYANGIGHTQLIDNTNVYLKIASIINGNPNIPVSGITTVMPNI